MTYRFLHTLLEKMQKTFPSYAAFPQDRKENYVLITVETFPAASRIEEFAVDENGKFKPTQTLTNIRIEKNRDDNSIVTLEHNGARTQQAFHEWHKMRHGCPRNTMYPLLTCDEGYLLAVEDIILFE
ncbi:hypothetical protein PRIPAC_97298 [Pristionchus pacificus]|uniref:Uncharacterized protein n=1 Tax=Pristionchus pacificus TaxID=54126 RepID=A0A454XZT4_PRIPA|nr:hypothetical protein PRIPAC_97298 [Pristionchus pacificus]|eukprot:PDM84527.1 hypothetical protein PRIPAC_33550 [Pristionchus pacificus]